MVKLIDRNPEWINGYNPDGPPIPKVSIRFDCPCGCGTRSYIPFNKSLDTGEDYHNGGGWEASGTSFEDLTLHPSLQQLSECRWHGWLKDGIFTEV